eukprot:2442611-Rhodomonas_salina.1
MAKGKEGKRTGGSGRRRRDGHEEIVGCEVGFGGGDGSRPLTRARARMDLRAARVGVGRERVH